MRQVASFGFVLLVAACSKNASKPSESDPPKKPAPNQAAFCAYVGERYASALSPNTLDEKVGSKAKNVCLKATVEASADEIDACSACWHQDEPKNGTLQFSDCLKQCPTYEKNWKAVADSLDKAKAAAPSDSAS